jgi:hypothetical protein
MLLIYSLFTDSTCLDIDIYAQWFTAVQFCSVLHKCHKEKATGSVAVTESYRSNYRNRSIYFYNRESNHFRQSSTNHCVLEILVIKRHLILPVTYNRSTLYYFLTYKLNHRSTHAHARTHMHRKVFAVYLICGRSLAGSAGSNPAGGKDVCLL